MLFARSLSLAARRACQQRLATPALATPVNAALLANRRMGVRSMSTESEEPDLDGIAYGYMASQALFAALDIGVFDAIEKTEGGLTIEGLKTSVNITAPRLQTLMTALVGNKLVKRDPATGKYTNPKSVSRFMVQDAKHYYGDYFKFQIGKQFYQRMGDLPNVMTTGDAPDYSQWFSDPETAKMYTMAQHNGSMATAKGLFKAYDFSGVNKMLDVGGGSGAFDIVFCQKLPALQATVLELPEVAKTGEGIVTEHFPDVADRIKFHPSTALDSWPVPAEEFDMVLMSYVSGSIPGSFLPTAYEQAYKALKPGGRLVVHDFMVDDSLDGPPLAALWALQHVPINAEGQGLYPQWVSDVMATAGFSKFERAEMIGGLTKLVVGYKQ